MDVQVSNKNEIVDESDDDFYCSESDRDLLLFADIV